MHLGSHPVTLLDQVKYPAALVQSNSILHPRLLRTSDLQTWWAVEDDEGQGITYQTTYLLWVSVSKTSTRAFFHGQIDTGGLRSIFFSENGRSSFTSIRVRYSQSCSIRVELKDDMRDQLYRCVSEVTHCILNGRETSHSADPSDEYLELSQTWSSLEGHRWLKHLSFVSMARESIAVCMNWSKVCNVFGVLAKSFCFFADQIWPFR